MKIKIKNFTESNYTWILQYGYPQDEYYDNSNTFFYQSFDEAPDEIYKFANKYFLPNYSITMMKQPPGSFIPRHRDKHYRFKSKNKKINSNKIVRYCVFLSEWKPGHYFEYNDKPIKPWSRGQILVLEKDIYHRSANAGTQFKYTAQITGVLK